MNPPITCHIDASHSQTSRIEVAAGLHEQLAARLAPDLAGRTVLVVTDSEVARQWGEPILAALRPIARKLESFVLPSGESSKSVEQLAALWQRCGEIPLHRDSRIIALGGGVVGDLAGLVAATYARGLDWIQIPTTLMAQVDSAIGGKTGINLAAGKNLVGTFWQPIRVLVDPHLLRTLDERQFRSGLAEIVKYAVLSGGELLQRLERLPDLAAARDPVALEPLVGLSCQIKGAIVQSDPREERGERLRLNYGHTFGHAIEWLSHRAAAGGPDAWTHGESIAAGMSAAAAVAQQLGLVDAGFRKRQNDLLTRFGLPVRWSFEGREIVGGMRSDKKHRGGTLQLVLPAGFGDVRVVQDVDEERILSVLEAAR